MELCAPQFAEFDRMAEYNGERVLKAFIDNRISDIHMKGTNGYGYGDDGRDKLDAVFAQILGAEKLREAGYVSLLHIFKIATMDRSLFLQECLQWKQHMR